MQFRLTRRGWEIGAASALALVLFGIGAAYARQQSLNHRLAAAIDAHDPDLGWQLVRAGADVNTRGPTDKGSLLHIFCEQADGVSAAQVRALLARGAHVNFPDKDDPDALAIAAQSSSREVVELLLDAGAVVNRAVPSGATPLACAACEGKTENVRLLLQRGARVNAADPLEGSALTSAVYSSNPETVRVLLEAGAASEPPRPYTLPRSPIHLAASRKGCEPMLRLMLQHGANPDAQEKDGMTPLMAAACENRVESVKLLLSAGARTDLKDRKGETALDLAGSAEVERLLRRASRSARRRR